MTGSFIVNKAFWGAICIAIVGVVFDFATPLGVAAGVIYTLFVLTAIWFHPPYTAFIFAAIGTVLTLKGYFLISDIREEAWIVVLNRILSVLALWVVAFIVHFQKKTAITLAQSEARYSTFINNAVDGMITIDEVGTIESANPACIKIFGYETDEIIGKNVKILMPEPYHSEHDGYLNNYRDTGDKKIIGIGREVKGLRKDGSVFPLDLAVHEINLEGKRLFGGTVRDISERKNAEAKIGQIMEQLEKSEARYSTFINNAVDGMITINDHGTIESANPACVKIFGYETEEIIGKNVKMLMPEPYHSEHDGYLKNYCDTGDKKIIGIGREVKGLRKNGSVFSLDLAVHEINLEETRLFGGTVRDISERKNAEVKLNRTMEDLKLTNEELEKFAYVASHDLKSPLRAIDNLTKWLEEDLEEKLDDKNRERMDKLRGRVTRMEHLLDDLLEYSRAGRKLDDTKIIDVEHLIDNVINLLNVPSGITVNVDKSLNGITIMHMPLEQVFHNFISNAIKHHDKDIGKITVSANENDMFYEFSITDDGPGIPEKFQDKIFEMFQTLKPRDEVEGSGMGLALVKKIIYRFGGRISVNSKEGAGTTFTFTWPKNPKIQSITFQEKEQVV